MRRCDWECGLHVPPGRLQERSNALYWCMHLTQNVTVTNCNTTSHNSHTAYFCKVKCFHSKINTNMAKELSQMCPYKSWYKVVYNSTMSYVAISYYWRISHMYVFAVDKDFSDFAVILATDGWTNKHLHFRKVINLLRTGFRNAIMSMGVGYRDSNPMIKTQWISATAPDPVVKYAIILVTVELVELIRLPVSRNRANFATALPQLMSPVMLCFLM